MVGKPVSLLGHQHVCPMVDPGPKPHVGGPIQQVGQTFVTVGGVPVATISDKALCTGGPVLDPIVAGSTVANINGKAIARMLDPCSHGGKIVQGIPWILCE